MEVKRDILWRVYLCFLGIVAFSVVIIARAAYIQQAQGAYWIAQAKEQQQRYVEIEAQRGTIFSEDGRMLSTSIPYFDIYIDFMAEGLREKDGRRFKDHVDSLALSLAILFKDKSGDTYRQELKNGFKKKSRYHLLKRNINFQQYKKLRSLPLVRLGKDKSGFIAEVKDKRLNPFGLLANRTIGLSREYLDTDGRMKSTNVGLEKTYDSLLRGESGKRLMNRIAAGVFVPVDGSEIEPRNGKNIVTTIDVNIQDIAENALLRVMTENECTHGTCIVMEVATGKIKAIANLGRKDGAYSENLNYAIQASEPGSTFKLATMLSLLEDDHVALTDHVDLEKGQWKVNGRIVYDSEYHGLNEVTVKEAFMHSSNVGMAKLVMANYVKDPLEYIGQLKKMHFDKFTGIDLVGETYPVIKTPKSRTWSATTLPWMSFGYEVLVSPMQTLMLYNAVANNGKMMKPYLVNAVQDDGVLVDEMKPTAMEESICSNKTLKSLKEILEAACMDSGGTGYHLFKDSWYRVAGKTGTALVANGNRGYNDHIYQSSFAGYFPAGNPQYTCIVVIRNKPFAPVYYGAKIAGPVFKEVADKLIALSAHSERSPQLFTVRKDSIPYQYTGAAADMKIVLKGLQWAFKDSVRQGEWGQLYPDNYATVLHVKPMADSSMPDVRGMGLKDALYLLENMQLKVRAKGKGKVSVQSIAAGTAIAKNQMVTIELN